MAGVRIQKVPQATAPVWTLFEDTKRIFDQLQSRAYGLFKERNGADGSPWDDWFRAEQELFNIPPSDLTEDDKTYRLAASVPGLQAKDVEVTATPHELVVRGSSDREAKREEGRAVISERRRNEVFRRYELSSPIDVQKVAAKVEDGVLRIEMPKASVAVQKIPVVAASKDRAARKTKQ